MLETNYDSILKEYCSVDAFRNNLLMPFLFQDKIFSSDGVIIFSVNHNNVKDCYAENGLEMDKIINKEWEFLIDVNIDSLINLINTLPTEKLYSGGVECEECNGSGEVTCYHCDSEVECKKCNGTGYTTPQKCIGEFPLHYKAINFISCDLSARSLLKICKTLKKDFSLCEFKILESETTIKIIVNEDCCFYLFKLSSKSEFSPKYEV